MINKENGASSPRSEIDEEAQSSCPESLGPAGCEKVEGADSPTVEEELERIRTGANLDWESSQDIRNPRNWSFGKRVFHTLVPALYGFVV